MTDLPYTANLRGVKVFQNGVQVPNTGRVAEIDITDADVSYDAANGRLTIGPGATFGAGVEVGDVFTWDGTIHARRRGWITPSLDLTGGNAAANTAAIRAALTAAGNRRGSVVYLPEGLIAVDDGASDLFTVPPCVTVTGPERGNSIGHREFAGQTVSGATLLVTGTGNLFTLSHDSRVLNLETYYPDQETNATPDVYGWTVDVPANAHFATVAQISCLNAYKFLRATGANGITVDQITGFPLSQGIHLGRVADVARISNCHWIPTAIAADTPNSTLLAWVQANGTAYLIDGAEECAFTDCFAYGFALGVHLTDLDADGFRGTYGSWKGGGLDLMGVCVRVSAPTGLCALGFRMSDCGLIPQTTTGRAIHFSDTAAPSIVRDRPRLMLTNVSVHNTHDRVIVMDSGSYGIVTWIGGHIEGYSNPAVLLSGANATVEFVGVTRSSTPLVLEPSQPGKFTDVAGAALTTSSEALVNPGPRVRLTAQAANISATNLYLATPREGQYEADVYLEVTAAGTSGTLVVTIGYTDAAGATSQATAGFNITGTGRQSAKFTLVSTGAAQITYAVSGITTPGSLAYNLSVVMRGPY